MTSITYQGGAENRMYYHLFISGILLTQMTQTTGISLHSLRGKVYTGMTVDKSANRRGMQNATDEMTLIALYEQLRGPIHSYCYRLLGSQEDADDVTQEVFIRAFTSWNGLYDHDGLSSWLYRIATNLSVDILRRRKRISWRSLSMRYRREIQTQEEVQEDLLAYLADSGGIPEIAERELIRSALANIPEEYAVVLVLSAAQGFSYQEIARILDISPNAAATRISRAKKMFVQEYHRVNKDGVGKREH
jgi:RNA polymerase sigma-70 factor, ECF subfamily